MIEENKIKFGMKLKPTKASWKSQLYNLLGLKKEEVKNEGEYDKFEYYKYVERAKWKRKKRMTWGIEWSIVVDAGCSGEWHFHYDGP